MQRVSEPVKTCSICGKGGVLRRGWCNSHYQRWYRTGNADEGERKRVTFSRALWDRWLAELNAPAGRHAGGINDFRQRCARRERV